MASAGPQKKFSDIVSEAFGFQTFEMKKSEMKYIHSDVQTAHEAYKKFVQIPSLETLKALLTAVNECSRLKRTGFDTLKDNVKTILAQVEENSRSSSTMKPNAKK